MEENLNQKREKKAFQEALNKDSKKKGIYFFKHIINLLNNFLSIYFIK